MKLHANSENFVQIAQWIRPGASFVFRKCVIFSFFGPTPHSCIDWGKIWCEWDGRSSHNFTHISSRNRKTSKSP